MTREQASQLGILLAMGGVFGGWLMTIQAWGEIFATPAPIGGLMVQLAAAYGGGKMMQAFDAIRALPRENPPPVVTEQKQVERSETPEKITETVTSVKTTETPKEIPQKDGL